MSYTGGEWTTKPGKHDHRIAEVNCGPDIYSTERVELDEAVDNAELMASAPKMIRLLADFVRCKEGIGTSKFDEEKREWIDMHAVNFKEAKALVKELYK